MRKTMVAGLTVGVVAALGLALPANASTSGEAQLSVLHGIPDTPVDVYVNGDLTLDDFQPGDLAGPLALPAGAYDIALTATDAADASAAILEASVTLDAGVNYTATANLNEAGEPALNAFVNDTAQTAAGEGRLTVRHVAAAPAVDILAGGSPVVEDLTNPNEATLNLPAGTVSAAVALAGTTDPVIGPADVNVAEGTLTIVYAWGSAEAGNLALAVQTIEGLHGGPSGGVPSGAGGQLAAQDTLVQGAWLAAGLLVAFGVAGGTVVAVRARSGR